MATPASPTPDQIVRLTGLNVFIQNTDNQTFLDFLADITPDAEAKVAVAVGEALFDSSNWTTRKALLLTRAIAYEVAAISLVSQDLAKVTGTHEPLLLEDAEEVAKTERRFQLRSMELITLATQGDAEDQAFALPAVDSGTFSVIQGDRSPADLNDLEDERDDIKDEDVNQG